LDKFDKLKRQDMAKLDKCQGIDNLNFSIVIIANISRLCFSEVVLPRFTFSHMHMRDFGICFEIVLKTCRDSAVANHTILQAPNVEN
jgi:hypothetical protein